MNRLRLLPGILLSVVVLSAPLPAPGAEDALRNFDGFLRETIKAWNVPGMAVGIVRSNQLIYAKGLGYRDVERELPVTSNTLFAIGSTTKAFTAFLIGTLVDEGKLDWDAPVRSYLPEFRLRDSHANELTTPRDLLAHRSGLPRHDMAWFNNNGISRRELVQRLEHLEASQPFRAKFQYNNLMYVAAGYLVETVTEQSWEDNVRTRIFGPLGMTNSNFSVRTSQRSADFALPYREKSEEVKPIAFRSIDLVGPAGSINSSIEEMSRWLMLNLNGGKIGERRLIKASTLADIHSPQVTMGATMDRPDISQPIYCLGWAIETYRGHRRLSHSGGIDGFVTQVSLLPDVSAGIVVFANLDSTPLCAIVAKHAIDRLLGLTPVDWHAEALAKREKGKASEKEARANKGLARKSGTNPAHALNEYAGEYVHRGYGTLQVNLREAKLEAAFNGMKAPLEHWHYEVFSALEDASDKGMEDRKFNFHTDMDGNVAAVAVKFESAVKEILFERRIDSRLSDTNYLARFVGEFDLSGHTLKVALTGNALQLTVPGEPVYQLVPKLDGSFTIKEHTTFSLKFVDDPMGVNAVQVHRPSGVVRAPRKM